MGGQLPGFVGDNTNKGIGYHKSRGFVDVEAITLQYFNILDTRGTPTPNVIK